MELDVIKTRKLQLEKQILKLKQDFERQTGVTIVRINVDEHGFFAGDRISTVEVEIRI